MKLVDIEFRDTYIGQWKTLKIITLIIIAGSNPVLTTNDGEIRH